jgi:phosphopantothenoylcysteine decarboxylase/phosphopantothenate--cysteine ligase
MDPTSRIRGIKSSLLKGKKIVLGITGSVSAEETVKLSRELIRHGAEVYPVMSQESLRIITKTSLQFAAGREPITEISGLTEHVILEDECDLMLIAPCSANTISKIAHGIGDTPVTLFALTFLGSKPMLIAPAMSESMWRNPVILENIGKLRSLGVRVLDPRIEEGKAKLQDNETIVANTIAMLNDFLKNKRVLVIGGGSEEPIDDVRVITNRSTGRTSIEIARVFFYHGGDVTLLLGRSEILPPPYIRTMRFSTVEDLVSRIESMRDFDLIIVPGALSDFTVKKMEGKIKSDKELKIDLIPSPKFLEELRKEYRGDLIAFKAEFDDERIIEEARKMISKYSLRFVVGNNLSQVRENETSIMIIGREKIKRFSGSKFDAAMEILRSYVRPDV